MQNLLFAAGCFAFVVFWVSCHCCRSLPFPRLVWSKVCDCGISWSYSIFFSQAVKSHRIKSGFPALSKADIILKDFSRKPSVLKYLSDL